MTFFWPQSSQNSLHRHATERSCRRSPQPTPGSSRVLFVDKTYSQARFFNFSFRFWTVVVDRVTDISNCPIMKGFEGNRFNHRCLRQMVRTSIGLFCGSGCHVMERNEFADHADGGCVERICPMFGKGRIGVSICV